MKIRFLIILVISLFPLLSFAQNSNTVANRPIPRSAANVAANAATKAVMEAANKVANGSYQPTPEKPKTKIIGRVIYEDTGKPVRRGEVSLIKIKTQIFSDSSKNYQYFENVYPLKTITNDDGEFEIDKVEAGEYFPKINVVGVLNPETFRDLYEKDREINQEKVSQMFEKIVVIEGVNEQQILIRAKRGGAISGKILYADGEPAKGVSVEALRKGKDGFEDSSSIGKTTTDDRGFYRFVGLPEGEYVVRIIEPTIQNIWSYRRSYSSNNTSELKIYYGDSDNLKKAKRIQVSIANEESEININIPDRKKFSISGKIIAKTTRKPIENAQIKLENTEEADNDEMSYLTKSSPEFLVDKDGNWKIIDLPKGKYKLEVSVNSNYIAYSDNNTPRKPIKYATIAKEIEIKDENLSDITIEMPIASQVSGTIRFEDKREVIGINVSLFDEEKDLFSYLSIDSDNEDEDEKTNLAKRNFTITDVAEGNFFFGVSSDNKEPIYIKSATYNGLDLLSSPLKIKENSDIKGLEIVLATDVGTLKGKIEADEKTLKSLRFMLVPTGNQNSSELFEPVEFSETGEFEIKVAPREYFLIAQPKSFFAEIRKLPHLEWLSKITQNAEKVVIKPKETTTVTIKK